ncbi:hypothetical protein EV363DRAFT_1523908, partial [Boletus edulis]
MFQGPANTFGTCTWFSTEGPSTLSVRPRHCLSLGPYNTLAHTWSLAFPKPSHISRPISRLIHNGPMSGSPESQGQNYSGLAEDFGTSLTTGCGSSGNIIWLDIRSVHFYRRLTILSILLFLYVTQTIITVVWMDLRHPQYLCLGYNDWPYVTSTHQQITT